MGMILHRHSIEKVETPKVVEKPIVKNEEIEKKVKKPIKNNK